MKRILFILFSLFLISCGSTKIHPKKIYVNDLKNKNQIWGIKNNSYFYFMIDSLGDKHLVKTSFLNSSKVIWIEKLNKR